jgi:FlaA1/EpsC-like NDP-sugar epimerase
MTTLKSFYSGKTILVTGGSGSIGSGVVRMLLGLDPASVRVLDVNENGIFNLVQELHSRRLRPFIGDVRDEKRVMMAVQDADVVIHAAALKHVPLSEYNPLEAVNVNIQGTQNVISAAIQANVGRVINISTDKAVDPINVMGATKMVAERLITNAPNYMGGNRNTTLCSVRFGNVLNSSGSVIPLFKGQIRDGGPLTLTSKKMTRFFLPMRAATEFILNAGTRMEGREIYIPKMPALKIIDLAKVLIDEGVAKHGIDPKSIELKITGPRPGEKLHEALLTAEEGAAACEEQDMFVLKHPLPTESEGQEQTRNRYDSRYADFLDLQQIKDLLESIGD